MEAGVEGKDLVVSDDLAYCVTLRAFWMMTRQKYPRYCSSLYALEIGTMNDDLQTSSMLQFNYLIQTTKL